MAFWPTLAEYSRNVFTNWSTYDAPFRTKAKLFARNVWSRARTPGHRCCGHHGEPGC
jgi:hypothetical protein